MKKYHYVIYVDATNKVVKSGMLADSEFDEIYKFIGTNCLDHASSPPNREDVRLHAWVDDTGMLKEPQPPAFILPQLYRAPLFGNAVLWASHGADTIDFPHDSKWVRDRIYWEAD